MPTCILPKISPTNKNYLFIYSLLLVLNTNVFTEELSKIVNFQSQGKRYHWEERETLVPDNSLIVFFNLV